MSKRGTPTLIYMKRFFLILLACPVILVTACNNSADTNKNTSVTKTRADSLYDEVMEGHDAGMGKMGKLTRVQQEVSRLIDSIGKLPAKTREAAAPYKAKLENLLTELKSAENDMNQWMESFNLDSAVNDSKERVRYLTTEKVKVSKVKDAIIDNLQKADSVLRQRF
jgi:phage host-nuclease inhibitor protein Gam